VRSDGRSLLRLDRGGSGGEVGPLTPAAEEALATAAVVLVADYGRGVASAPGVRDALTALAAGRTPLVWDPHPRGSEPVPGVTLVTPNGSEARHFAPGHDGALLTATTARARELAERWSATAVSVTLSGRGALIVSGDGAPSVVPAPQVPCPDPCGAGDRFASAAAGLLADGALPSEAVAGAVAAASAFVAAGGAASVRVGERPERGGGTRRRRGPGPRRGRHRRRHRRLLRPAARRHVAVLQQARRWATAWSSCSTATPPYAGSRARPARCRALRTAPAS
jgi:bifunctional ADP-heptose synthase (sugar kinase/adenylyltransferase)